MSSKILMHGTLVVAAVAPPVALWTDPLFPLAILVSGMCLGLSFLTFWRRLSSFSLFSLSQPPVLVAWYASPLLSILLELLLLGMLLISGGLLASRREIIAWVLFTPVAAVLLWGMSGYRHVLIPLAVSLVIAGILWAAVNISEYRLTTRPSGGYHEDI